jgi:hypothetical protein
MINSFRTLAGGTCKDVAVFTMKTYKRISGIAPLIFTSALNGEDWSFPRPRPLNASGNHGIRGWVFPTAGSDALGNRKIPRCSLELNDDFSFLQPIHILATKEVMLSQPFFDVETWMT